MLPYLLVLSFVTFWILLEQKALNRKSFWIPWVALSLFAGIRSYLVGTDSGNYTQDFRNQLNVDYFKFNETVEFGYQLFEYALLNITHNYFWFFFITSSIVVYCYLSVIKKHSVNYTLSVFLFITLGVYTFFFNGLRQGLAMAIFAFSLSYLLERRFFLYFLICLGASLFHITALFMIPFYFLVNLRIKLLNKILLVFIGSLFTSKFLISYLADTNERYEGYATAAEKAGGLLTLGFYTVLLFLIYFVIRLYKIRDDYLIKLFTFYATGIVFLIPVAMLGANPSGPQRLLTYFTWTLVLILPFIFKRINNLYVTSTAIILFVIYFILTTTRFSNLTPYMLNPIFEIL
ncbi:EpsG family protein [Psychrobacter sp. Sarcosine-3u-12]|uniref:EpsG family protein n=1 Tax=Psychrobacter sp. Sarcosine-3u-12 TaxID=2058325 RepID=UPI000C32ABB2|nr:EpsG family protein [Psychrobacter sp. Sarcosine-3u-12]PKG36542.1 EpsG family protein [Psychrobacter sp. Sarcosine-3u-12]